VLRTSPGRKAKTALDHLVLEKIPGYSLIVSVRRTPPTGALA
jgi:hypothetical protein